MGNPSWSVRTRRTAAKAWCDGSSRFCTNGARYVSCVPESSYGNAELAKQNDALVADHLARIGRVDSLRDRVHALLVEHLPDGGPSEATIAQRLCMSPRNLQLQLAQEGTSYKVLLNCARQDLARSYLQKGKYSIKEIAFLLGFSDDATFTRAFRRWTGQSPRRFADEAGPI